MAALMVVQKLKINCILYIDFFFLLLPVVVMLSEDQLLLKVDSIYIFIQLPGSSVSPFPE